MNNIDVVRAIKAEFPTIDWDAFEDADRALNWELWHGELPSNYWKDTADGDAVEPLEHYEWKGWVQAQEDIINMLDTLPQELWWDDDADMLLTKDPEQDDYNWRTTCKFCGETLRTEYRDKKLAYVDDSDGNCCSGNDEGENANEPHESDDHVFWFGPEYVYKIDPRKELMHKETFNQVF